MSPSMVRDIICLANSSNQDTLGAREFYYKNNNKCFIDNREVSTNLCVIQIITGLD